MIFIHWLHYRLNPDEYCIIKTIDHGVRMVELGREMKKHGK